MRRIIVGIAAVLVILLTLFPPHDVRYESRSGMSFGEAVQHRPLWSPAEWTEEYGNVKYDSSVNMRRYALYLALIVGSGVIGYAVTKE